MKLTDMQESVIKHVLLYGPPKSGKTELAGKLAEKFKLLWFDLEKGVSTLLKLPAEWKDRIEVIQIPDTRSNPMAIETILKVVKGGPMKVCEEHGKVNCPLCMKEGKPLVDVHLNALGPDWCVVFDSMTQLTNSCIANITRNKPDDYKMEWDDYNHMGKVMDMVLSHIQAAPYNAVVISHENMVEQVNKTQKIVPVAGSSNFSRNSAKYFDEVVYCEIKNKKHTFASSTTYANNIMTGGRSGHFLESSGEPKLLNLWSVKK